ncbi:MAG TPA: hypothetical protein VNZ26_11440, partial [Vicinamibacterales bacterium]|nr:hypothetical protein [Vicinamibacterales bacterium]
MDSYSQIRELLDRVRARWRRLQAYRAILKTALAAALVIGVALVAARWTAGAPLALTLLAGVTFVSVCGLLAWGLWPLRQVPSDSRVARFIEERTAHLEDRLVSAVEISSAERSPSPTASRPASSALAHPLLVDAATHAKDVDLDLIVPP